MSSTRVFHRHLHHTPPLAVSGKGVWLTDSAGKQYLDASGGAAVSCLGHGHPDVLAAMHAQIDRLAYAHTSFFTTEVAEDLAQHLIARAPAGHEPCLFRQRRLGGDRGGAEDGAPVLRRDRPAAAQPLHRAPPELSRQHARRAGGRRQRVAARAVRAAPDRRRRMSPPATRTASSGSDETPEAIRATPGAQSSTRRSSAWAARR